MTVNSDTLYNIFLKEFPETPTRDQNKGLRDISDLLCPNVDNLSLNDVFILMGYAGTGKTTLARTVARVAENYGWKLVLAAPTGRAAKVLQGVWGLHTLTLHRMIYKTVRGPDGYYKRILKENRGKNIIFIIDEASMISDNGENGNMLGDLFYFLKSGKNCKLILVGDNAQLPPVGQINSPALDIKKLRTIGINCSCTMLKQIMRQDEKSGIIDCADALRKAMFAKHIYYPVLKPSNEVCFVNDLFDLNNYFESSFGHSEFNSVVITRSNSRAVLYNRQIRTRLLGYDDIINAGDLVMVVQNNEFWMDKDSGPDFIANGDIFKIISWRNEENKYGLHFADASLEWMDFDEPNFDAKIILNTLDSNTARLSREQSDLLHSEIMIEFKNSGLPNSRRSDFFMNHPYGQALQLKFGYALTAHKAQGGQWDDVFVERPYIENPAQKDYLRWLYTSFTRAKSRLFLIGFPEGINHE